ncbi:hypothetical protein QYE76_020775 [Lolium multiflorum]|uniref:DDE Tnp4 domain-containing protein n=1 Tax=Lolium multiflorum TaxID=4521 RepID=A0AAD8VSJ4_LOLMU|nr:hypothetical protein QYE76_020775 [Lolium multiflorum]
MAGEAKIPAALRDKGRGNLPLRLPSTLAPSQILHSPNFRTGGGDPGSAHLPSVSSAGPGSSSPAAAEPAHICGGFQTCPLSAMTEVLYAIGELRGEKIKLASMNTPTKIKNSYRWFLYFRDCIGAIDGTHVTANVSRSISAAFRRKKHYTSQNVLAAMDFDMRFTYVLAGWEGSSHDVSILADSLSRPDGLQIPEGWGEDEFFEEVSILMK